MEFCKVDDKTSPIPKSVFGLKCHDNCPDGTFATVDYVTKEMVCNSCPANTYSVGGGGIRIDGSMGAFANHSDDGNAMPLRMEPSCQVHPGTDEEFFEKDEDCTPWTRTGTSLKAYESAMTDVLVDYDLSYPVYFDEDGSVEFKYRKDSIGTESTTYGVFKFLIDGEVQYIDNIVNKNDW